MDNTNLARLQKLKNSYEVLKRVSLDEYKLVIERVRDEIAGETEQVRPVKPFKGDYDIFRETVFNDSPHIYATHEYENDPFGWEVSPNDWDL